MHWSQSMQNPLSGTFSSVSLSISYGHASIHVPHCWHLIGLYCILFLLTIWPLISLSISESVNAPCGHTTVHAPHLVHMLYDGSSSTFIFPGIWKPFSVTTLIASLGHFLAQAPSNLHFSSSHTTPSSVVGFAGPNSTSNVMASTGHNSSHKPQAVQISGNLTV